MWKNKSITTYKLLKTLKKKLSYDCNNELQTQIFLQVVHKINTEVQLSIVFTKRKCCKPNN